MSLILIRYGELALKSHKVRRRFEEKLLTGIQRQFSRFGITWMIERQEGRFFLHVQDEELRRSITILQHIPGIFSVSPVDQFEITNGLNTIGDTAARFAIAYLKRGQSFAVRARRAGSHAFTSQEAAGFAGERILETIPDLHVDLTNPDVVIHLEVRARQGYLFTQQFRGMGGLPPGSQGNVLLLLSGPMSMAAGYLIMKRGCTLIPLHFSDDTRSEPERNKDGTLGNEPDPFHEPSVNDPTERAEQLLGMFDPNLSSIQHPTLMNEAEILEIMRSVDAQAVVTGHRIENLDPSYTIGKEPVFFPLMGYDEKGIQDIIRGMEAFHDVMTKADD